MTMLFTLQPSRIREAISLAETPAHGVHPSQRNDEEEAAKAFVAALLRSMASYRPQLLTLAREHGFPCPADEPPALTGAAPSADSLAELFGLKKKGHR